MKTTYRTSPLDSALGALGPQWADICNMRVPFRFSSADESCRKTLGMADFSFLSRFGLKGPGAEAWLVSQGVAAPVGVNRWTELPGDGVMARLGSSEFFVEDWRGATATELRAALAHGAPGIAPVHRQDAAIVLTGRRASELLVQTCSVNFHDFDKDERTVIMTSMVGVSVLVIPRLKGEIPFYRIWCDGTYGPYLWKTLLEIAKELGGGPVGMQAFASVLDMENQPANQQS